MARRRITWKNAPRGKRNGRAERLLGQCARGKMYGRAARPFAAVVPVGNGAGGRASVRAVVTRGKGYGRAVRP